MELLTAYSWQGVVLLIWFALSVGSFLNVVIYRLPVMLEREWRAQAREILADEANLNSNDRDPCDEPFNLMLPRSRCPSCGHQIKAWQNIPVLSWLLLRGRCAGCAAPISLRYPGIEMLTMLTTIAIVATFGFTWFGLAASLCSWMLIALTFIDFDTKLLPDQITYPTLWLGLIANGFLQGLAPLHDAIAGAVAGYLFLWSVYWAFKLLTGKEGMGYGDFKLFAALGAWLGWQALPNVILIAATLGLIYALARIFTARQGSAEPIPFGPFLAVAGWVTLLFRDNVLAVFLP